MGKCPEHVTTPLTQALRICTVLGKERQARHLLTAYANVFFALRTQVYLNRYVGMDFNGSAGQERPDLETVSRFLSVERCHQKVKRILYHG